MRNFLKSRGRRLSTGWLWPLVLLALPACFLDSGAFPKDPEIFQPGNSPLTGLIMCEIPKVWPGDDCATQEDLDNSVGTPSTSAAVLLNDGGTAETVFDWSDAALLACDGKPRKVQFHGTYPNGLEVCLNCDSQIGTGKVYKDANEACVAKCQDLVALGEVEPPGSALEFCQARAQVSVNFNVKCFEGFCDTGGMPLGKTDPRLEAEIVEFTDFQGTFMEDALTLKFDGPGDGTFSAGAASVQLITEGDAWVEFDAGETGKSHAVGVRTSCPKILDCPDDDGTLGDLPLVLNLNSNNAVIALENGATPLYTDPDPYTVGEKYRIHVTDNHDGTANISFNRLPSPCTAGVTCNETVLYPGFFDAALTAAYPLRVDVSFREGPATLQNVKVMRIIKK